jgi:ABC-type Zn uptake system ZnuABC Zn-binding protein ZnuA
MRIRILLFLTVFALCSTAQAQELRIATSFTILADITQQVAGNNAVVTSLMPVNADPHTFAPTPQDLVTLADANLVLINGVNFEEGLLDAIENAGEEMNIVTVSECVAILPVGGFEHEEEGAEDEPPVEESTGETDSSTAERCASYYAELGLEMPEIHSEDEAEATEEHANEPLGLLYALECGGREQETGDEHGHEEGSCDPHVWTNPENVMLWTLQIRDALSTLDPANAEIYSANAAAYVEVLQALDAELRALVDTLPQENRVLVTNHETLGYFAAHYGFELLAVVFEGGGTETEPGAAEVAALIDEIRAAGVSAIFAENTVGDTLIQQIANELSITVVTLYTDSLSEMGGAAATYLDYMRYNMQAIVGALLPQ